jgi:TetR/AcrR family acrAB operon transcriptional repressor
LNEIGDESRRRILDAAESLFIRRGVVNTSFALIEREAGISRGSIPWHFKNKNGLLMAIVRRAMVFSNMAVPEQTGHAGVRELLDRAQTKMRRPQAALLSSLLAESIRDDSLTHDEYREWHANSRRVIADLVRESPDELVLPPGVDEDAFSAILFGTMVGLHLQWRLAPDLVDLEKCFDALQCVLSQVLSSERAAAKLADD